MDSTGSDVWSGGTLTLVATPIGNLGDLSARARAALGEADVIFCEDTRRTRVLLAALGQPGAPRLRSLHRHTEAALVVAVVEAVRAGQRVVLVSDAGTPGISDPGRRVVAAVAAAGLVVTTVPGPSAVVAALSVSGFDADRFIMEGFLPRRGPVRRERLLAWRAEERTVVFFESPQRLVATLAEVHAVVGERPAIVARELTKAHEEIVRGTLGELVAHWEGREVRGEVVVVVAGATPAVGAPPDTPALRDALAARLAAGDSVRDAASAVAVALRVSRRDAYEEALRLRPERPE